MLQQATQNLNLLFLILIGGVESLTLVHTIPHQEAYHYKNIDNIDPTTTSPVIFGTLTLISPSSPALITPSLLISLVDSDKFNQQFASSINIDRLKMESDIVKRVVNANVIKLEKRGLVSFAGIQTPTGYKEGDFPECMSFTPASKAKQLLPPKTKVGIRIVEQKEGSPARALIVANGKLVNTELVRSGLAKPSPRGREQAEKLLPGLTENLENYQVEAKRRKVGVYQTCEQQKALTMEFNEDDQFEPLDLTVETKYFSDGGKQVLKERSSGEQRPPLNPGDSKGCSDFENYEAALSWFEQYMPYYGDVAKLDSDGDGVPCPGLPHTQDRERYRMKVPSSVKNRVRGVQYDSLPNELSES